VVITFADITVAKTLEAQLREKHATLEKFVAKQSAKPESASIEVTAKTIERKRTEHGVRKQVVKDLKGKL
jgi:hypothetical protein